MHTFGSIGVFKRMHVVHSVGFRKMLVLGRFTIDREISNHNKQAFLIWLLILIRNLHVSSVYLGTSVLKAYQCCYLWNECDFHVLKVTPKHY